MSRKIAKNETSKFTISNSVYVGLHYIACNAIIVHTYVYLSEYACLRYITSKNTYRYVYIILTHMYFYEHLSKCKNIFYRAPVFGFIHTEYFLRDRVVERNECHRILNACGFCATHCCGCCLLLAPLVPLFKSLIYFYLFFNSFLFWYEVSWRPLIH